MQDWDSLVSLNPNRAWGLLEFDTHCTATAQMSSCSSKCLKGIKFFRNCLHKYQNIIMGVAQGKSFGCHECIPNTIDVNSRKSTKSDITWPRNNFWVAIVYKDSFTGGKFRVIGILAIEMTWKKCQSPWIHCAFFNHCNWNTLVGINTLKQ